MKTINKKREEVRDKERRKKKSCKEVRGENN